MQKTVLVTGASTGIGFDTVRNLIIHGFLVIATVRKEQDELILKKHFADQVKVLLLDVTDFAKVEKLPDLLKEKFNISELYAVVNNAGVAYAGPFMYQDFTEVQSIIQVNVLAVMKVTQVVLPLLKNGEPGRIINISSVAGKNAAPFLSIYAASKHAIEGFSEALRREMLLFGIKVVIIGPGSIQTPIWQKGFQVVKNKYAHTVFAESFSRFIEIALKEEATGLAVNEVSDLVVRALTVSEPKLRYAPIPRKFLNWYLPMLIPTKFFDKILGRVLHLSS